MRVLMVSKAVVVGAYQRKLEELAALPNVELIVLAPPFWRDRRGSTRLERAFTNGYQLIETPIAFNGRFHLHFYPKLDQQVRFFRPDIVHMDEEPYNFATAHGTWAAQRVGARVCFFTWQNLLRAYPPPFRWFEQYVFRSAAHALAGNQEAVSVLRNKGYKNPISVIPQFGVDPELFQPTELDAAKNSQPTRFVVGYAGGLLPEKGLDLLLRAAAPFQNIEVLLAGEGELEPALCQQAADLKMTERVQFVGKIKSTDMPNFYRRLNVFVLPSRTLPNWKEQFGRVLIEAMACGVPVVGASSGEIPNVIGDAGLTFPENDALALQNCLRELQENFELRNALGQKGRARVQERYTQAQIAKQTHAVYQQMLAEEIGSRRKH